MTPEEIAEIRARYSVGPNTSEHSQSRAHVLALCDALEAGWDRFYDMEANWSEVDILWKLAEARAEKAEAALCACGMPHYCQSEINGITARITEMLRGDLNRIVERAEKAEAALARVRELAENARDNFDNPVVWASDLLAALEEGQQ